MIVETKKGKLPIWYGWNSLAHFGDLTGRSMTEILKLDMTKFSMSDTLKFLYVGFVEGARKAGEECKVKDEYDIGDMVDDDAELVNKVMNVFSEQSAAKGGGSKKK